MRLPALLALVTAAIAPVSAQSAPTVDQYVIAGRIVDVAGGKVLTGHCIAIAGEKIAAVEPCRAQPENIPTIDWSAYTVLPGLMDLHTHLADAGQSADLALPLKTSPAATALIGAKNARDTLMAGFTTVRDLGTEGAGYADVSIKQAIEKALPGTKVDADPASKLVTVRGGGDYSTIRSIVSGVGYTPSAEPALT